MNEITWIKHEDADYGLALHMVRNGIMSHVPTDPANSDYQQYLAWVAEGNTAEEWNPQG